MLFGNHAVTRSSWRAVHIGNQGHPKGLAAVKLTLSVVLLYFAVIGQSHADKIYTIGDSITRGFTYTFDSADFPLSAYRNNGGAPPNNIRSYREHLHDRLTDAGNCGATVDWVGGKDEPGRIPVYHEGRSGWRADEIVNRSWADDSGNGSGFMIDDWLNIYDPDHILIHLGTNDMQQGQTAESTRDDIADLLDKINTEVPNAKVFLANVIPIYGWWADHVNVSPYPTADTAEEADQLTSLIGQLVSDRQALGEDIHLVDVNTDFYVNTGNVTDCSTGTPGDPLNMSTSICKVLPDGSGSEPDGIHPNIVGDKFIADKFFEALQANSNLCTTGGTDTSAPGVQIDVPVSPGQILPSTASLSGSATDTGGSGFASVDVSVLNAAGDYLDFGTGTFGTAMASASATLSNTSVTDTDWSITTPALADGSYTVEVTASDLAGNTSSSVSRSFQVNETPVGGLLFQEAENAARSGGMTIGTDVLASNGAFVSVPVGSESPDTANDFVEFSVDIETAGNYRIRAGVRGPSGTQNSFLVAVDGGTQYIWDLPQDNVLTDVFLSGRGSGELSFPLSVGQHTLRVTYREPNSQLDFIEFQLLGSTADTDSPAVTIGSPASAGATLASLAVLSGAATDTGGSGFASIDVSVLNATGDYLDFTAGTFGSSPVSTAANLSNTSATDTDWSITTPSLADGSYTVEVIASDVAGNLSSVASRGFIVDEADPGDTSAPIVSIGSPASAGQTLPSVASLSGSATDTGDSGFASVDVSVLNAAGDYLDFSTGTFGSTPMSTSATLDGTSLTQTNWSTTTPGLADGSYTVEVTASDFAGNTSSAVSRSFQVNETPVGGPLFQEAEDAVLSGGMSIGADVQASSGAYVSVPSGSESPDTSNDFVEFTVDIDTAGDYRVLAGVRGPSGSQNSFFVQVDGGVEYIWDLPADNVLTNVFVSGRAVGELLFPLSVGQHTFRATYREPDAQLDFIEFQPVGSSPDTEAPQVSITMPAMAGTTLPTVATLAGSATDTGGSGLDRVFISVENSAGLWLDFSNGQFSAVLNSIDATLSNVTAGGADWSVTTPSLVDDSYTVHATPVDLAGNTGSVLTRGFIVNESTTGGTLYQEAESALLSGGMTVGADVSASNGAYVSVPAGSESPDTANDYVEFTVDIETAGDYRILAGVRGISGSQNSFFVQVDGGVQYIWDLPQNNVLTNVFVSGRATGELSFPLSVGQHTFRATYRESDAQLDFIEFQLQGAATDADAPVVFINSPSTTGEPLSSVAPLNGFATDTGDSGFASVEVSVLDQGGGYLDFVTGTFGTSPTSASATLSNTSLTDTDWSITTPALADGTFTVQVSAMDGAGNLSSLVSRSFVVSDQPSSDEDAPVVTIASPGTAGEILPTVANLSGSAMDTGDSGFASVDVSVLNAAGDYLDFSTGAFGSAPMSTAATLDNTSLTQTNWSTTTPGLADGSYTVEVTASDIAGNTSSVVSRSFQVNEAPAGGPLFQEAEGAVLSGGKTAGSDTQASNGAFVSVPSGNESPDTANDYVEFTVDIDTAGDYRILAGVKGPSGSQNSFFVQVNAGTQYIWDLPRDNVLTDVFVSGRGVGELSFPLGIGQHTLRVTYREADSQLDYVDFQLQGQAVNTGAPGPMIASP